MKKNKKLIAICSVMLVIIIVVFAIAFIKNRNADTNGTPIVDNTENNNDSNYEGDALLKSLEEVKGDFSKDIESLKNGKFDNLVYHDFLAEIDDVEGVYRIKILTDNSYKDRTFIENFQNMKSAVDKFFKEDFDKSYIVADFYMGEETVKVEYDRIESVCVGEQYDSTASGFIFGNNVSNGNGGYMVQSTISLTGTWFSRGELGTIIPTEFEKVYPYVTCIRQVEDFKVKLKDGEVMLSQMEEEVLKFANQDFPLPVSENISYGIGEVRIIDNVEYEGLSFKIRRIYKGIPFEYGSTYSSGMYIDKAGNDKGEIDYAVSSYPDTMLSFGRVNGTVTETEEITKILTLNGALTNLSKQIGENSIYDIYGVELVYRNEEISDELYQEVDDILNPKWKIVTINSNDNKYTLFYVDAVTGEISHRFEYYYG